MKKIIVKWSTPKRDSTGYSKEMRVVYSNHTRFIVGSRFDFGFLQIASGEGYIIEILPIMNDLVSKLILPSFLRWICNNCEVYEGYANYNNRVYYLDSDTDVKELIDHYTNSL